jgi:Ca2+-binding RTX toxin-like protein
MITPLISPLEPRRLFSADLVATISVTPGAYDVGQQIPIIVRIRNAGTSTIMPSFSNVVLSRNKTIGDGDDISIGAVSTGGINTGQVIQQTLAPTVLGSFPKGQYFVGVRVDALQSVIESDERNTFFTDNADVNIPSPILKPGPITGTDGDDVILLSAQGGRLVVTINGVTQSGVMPDSLFIDAGAGDDLIIADPSITIPLGITGNVGDDTIVGGSGNDELSGSFGNDRIVGGAGDDLLFGGASSDYLSGELGNDLMVGSGGNDRLADVFGLDQFIGGAGNDTIIARDVNNTAQHNPDIVSGGVGFDRAQVDESPFPDQLSSIDELLA